MNDTRTPAYSDTLIIFDIDGTLLQTERVTVPAVQRAFAAFGLPRPDNATICSFFGRPVEDYEVWLAAQCPAEQAREIVEATNALELRLIGEEGKLYPGARETLRHFLDAGFTLAICSNGPDAYVNEFLDAHDLRAFFSPVYARDTRYAGKEEMVGLILDETKPGRFMVIGDRHDDIEAAHHWGGLAVAAGYGFGNAHEWRDADAIISTLSEAPACVAELLTRSETA